MVTITPLPAIPIRADAPILNTVQAAPNAPNLTSSINDVQHLIETASIRPDGGRGGGKGLRNRLRRLLEEWLKTVDDSEDDDEARPVRLWYPPTAFSISRILLLSRLGFLELIEKQVRIALLALRPLDDGLRLNEAFERLASGNESGSGPDDVTLGSVTEIVRNLFTNLRANLDLVQRYYSEIIDVQKKTRQAALDLFQLTERDQNQEDELCRLVGRTGGDAPDMDYIAIGCVGACNEATGLFLRMIRSYDGFREEIERVVNANFHDIIVANGEIVAEPTRKPAGTPLLDCRDVAFKNEQRRLRIRMSELAILRDVITLELAMRGEPETPRHLRSYARTEGLVVRRPDDSEPIMKTM